MEQVLEHGACSFHEGRAANDEMSWVLWLQTTQFASRCIRGNARQPSLGKTGGIFFKAMTAD